MLFFFSLLGIFACVLVATGGLVNLNRDVSRVVELIDLLDEGDILERQETKGSEDDHISHRPITD